MPMFFRTSSNPRKPGATFNFGDFTNKNHDNHPVPVHPSKINWKNAPSYTPENQHGTSKWWYPKRNILLEQLIFRFHVNFSGYIILSEPHLPDDGHSGIPQYVFCRTTCAHEYHLVTAECFKCSHFKKNSHLKSMKYKSLKPSLQKLTAGMEATNGRLWKMIFPCKMVYVFFSVSSPISSVEVLCVSPFCS